MYESINFHKKYKNHTVLPWRYDPMDVSLYDPHAKSIEHKGLTHRRAIPEICKKVNAKTYIEIGYADGRCFSQVDVPVKMSVDPDPSAHGCTHVMTSDDFFINEAPMLNKHNVKLDVSFIDGLHVFEFALRDFIGVEKYSRKDSIVLFHDCLPRNKNEVTRIKCQPPWTGDVFKVLFALRKWRKDLKIMPLDSEPTGLGLVTNLNPESTILEENYEEIIREFIDLTYENINFNEVYSVDEYLISG